MFGEIGYQITDRWDITLGARYYDFTFDTLSDQDTPLFNTVFGGAGPDEINLVLQPTTLDDSGSLFKFNTSYRFNDDVLGYFTISEGYRFGAANGIAACPNPLPAESDRLRAARRVSVLPRHDDELRDRPAQPVGRRPPDA